MKALVVGLILAGTSLALADKGDPGYLVRNRDGSKAYNSVSAGGSTTATITGFNITGLPSWDSYGAVGNVVFTIPLLPNAHVIGIGWDTNQTAFSPSWLSEMTTAFEDTAITGGVYLTPGVSDSFPGTAAYSSGGIVDLVGLALDFNVGVDGLLRIELFESYNDFAGAADGVYNATSVMNVQWTPEPATMTLLALCGLFGLRRRR